MKFFDMLILVLCMILVLLCLVFIFNFMEDYLLCYLEL